MIFDALYLSPHFDDVVFSCGGNLYDQVQRGARVVVVTVCAAPPPTVLSPFAQSLHDRWRTLGDFDRAAEDKNALACLGAHYMHLPYHDCIYRQAQGQWLYASEDSLWQPPAPAEKFLLEELAQTLTRDIALTPNAEVWSPFGWGNHVDHAWVKLAAAAWGKRVGRHVRYYADYPYAAKILGGQARPCSDSAKEAKLKAMRCYVSQLSTFWADEAALTQAATEWVEREIV